MPNTTADEFDLDLFEGFKPFDKRIHEEEELRYKHEEDSLKFGISFLDDAFGCILKNDLVILGAKTGFGKTQVAVLTAIENALSGKSVDFYALESDQYEIERRIRYQMVCDIFFSMPNRPNISINYLDWYLGRFKNQLYEIESQIRDRKVIYPNLHIFYRTSDFTGKEFQRFFLGRKCETDLAIIDHLHYFDLEDQNENRAIKDVVKLIRDCTLMAGKPVVLISHIRKMDRKTKQIIPEMEDFHGSSEIGKIATKAFVIAPGTTSAGSKHKTTYFSIVKCRIDGSRTHSVAAIGFNNSTHRYEKEYLLGNFDFEGINFTPFEFDKIPKWAVNAKVVQMEKIKKQTRQEWQNDL